MIVEKACWERGCACYDHRFDEGVRVTLAQHEWQGLTENEIKHLWYEACQTNLELTSQLIVHLARNIEAKLKEKNNAL